MINYTLQSFQNILSNQKMSETKDTNKKLDLLDDTGSRVNRKNEFQELMKKAISAPPAGSLSSTSSVINTTFVPKHELDYKELEAKVKELESFLKSFDLAQASRVNSSKEDIKRRIMAIWMQFLMTGIISGEDLQFIKQHDPGLYKRILEMLEEKRTPKELKPESNDNSKEESKDSTTGKSCISEKQQCSGDSTGAGTGAANGGSA